MVELYYVEDDQNIAGIVKEYFREKKINVTIFSRIDAVREALKVKMPAMVLLDWNMPDGRGDELCRWIRKNWKELPVIFITVRGDCRDIVNGFEDGADDYVVKPFSLEVLYLRVQALLRRSNKVREQYLSCSGILIDREKRTVVYNGQNIEVSAVEFELLLYLMENKDRTVTREKILEQIWDVKGNYVNNNTLTVTMKRLRDKLRQPSFLKTVRSVGYRMEDVI